MALLLLGIQRLISILMISQLMILLELLKIHGLEQVPLFIYILIPLVMLMKRIYPQMGMLLLMINRLQMMQIMLFLLIIMMISSLRVRQVLLLVSVLQIQLPLFRLDIGIGIHHQQGLLYLFLKLNHKQVEQKQRVQD